jgi:hypothetical protein
VEIGDGLVGDVICAALLATALCLLPSVSDAEQKIPFQAVVSGGAHEALFDIAFSGASGIAVGTSGTVLSSKDSGKSWKREDMKENSVSLLGVAINGEHAIAVGQQGLILRRDGDRWLKSESGVDKRLFAVGLNSRNRALAVGAFGTALMSDDGGATWRSVAPTWTTYASQGEDPHIYVADVDEPGTLTMGGEFGLILRSSDAGKTWVALHSGDASIFAMTFRDDGIGYAVGQSGTVLRSADRGATWATLESGSKAILLGVAALPNGRVIASGMHDMIESKNDGKTWDHIGNEDVNTSWYLGVSYAAMPETIMAAGQSGRIIDVGQ